MPRLVVAREVGKEHSREYVSCVSCQREVKSGEEHKVFPGIAGQGSLLPEVKCELGFGR